MPTPIEILLDPVSLIIIAMYAGLMIWEALFPARKLPEIRFWKLKGLTAFFIFFYLSSYLPLLTDPYLESYRLVDFSGIGTAGGALIGVLLYEFGVYVWHRAMHRSDFLWKTFHQMHHSAERIDTYGAFFFSPMDMIGWTVLGSVCFALLIGITPQAITVVLLTTSFFSIFQHANIRTPRWLGYLIQRPESHTVHHAKGIHKHNYSDLPVFDILFGTFHNPKNHEYETGFYVGASGRIRDMLLFKDVTQPDVVQPDVVQPNVVQPKAGSEGATPRDMKKVALALGMGITTAAFSQNADQPLDFSAQKKSIELSTGITMKYVETGKTEGVPLILMHGVTDTGRSFQPMMEELLRINPDLHIIAPDLRGHGGTSLPDEQECASAPEQCFTPADFASDIIALMDQKNINKAHMVGHSMGSIVAQELALHHRERVNSLVLIGTFVNGEDNGAIHDFLLGELIEGSWKPQLTELKDFQWPEDAYTLTPSDLGGKVKDFLKKNWVYEIATDEAYLEAVLQETIQVPIGTWIGAIRALGEVDNRTTLPHLRVPTLVLWAIQDMAFPRADQEQVMAALQAASDTYSTRIIYKTYGKIPLPESGYQENDLGHNLQWAAPKEVAADVSAFIETGFPVVNTPYVNPENTRQVLTDESKADLSVWGSERVSGRQGK